MMRASQFVLARQTPAVAAYASSRLSPSDAVQFMQGTIGTQYESSCDHCRVVSHLGIASELDTSPLVTVRGADWCQLVDTAEQREWKDLHSEGYAFFDDLAMNVSDPLASLYATQATSDVAAVESQIVEDAHWEQLRALSAAIRGNTPSPSNGHQQHFDADHIAAGYLGHQPSSAETATLSATHQEEHENIIDEIRAFGTPAVQSEDLEQLTHEAYAGGLDSNLEDEPDRSLSSSDKPKSVKKKQVVKPLHFKPSSVDISTILNLSMSPTQRKPTLVDNTTTTTRDGAAAPSGPKEIDGVVASSTAEPSTLPHTDEADTTSTSPRIRAWSARKRTATHKHR